MGAKEECVRVWKWYTPATILFFNTNYECRHERLLHSAVSVYAQHSHTQTHTDTQTHKHTHAHTHTHTRTHTHTHTHTHARTHARTHAHTHTHTHTHNGKSVSSSTLDVVYSSCLSGWRNVAKSGRSFRTSASTLCRYYGRRNQYSLFCEWMLISASAVPTWPVMGFLYWTWAKLGHVKCYICCHGIYRLGSFNFIFPKSASHTKSRVTWTMNQILLVICRFVFRQHTTLAVGLARYTFLFMHILKVLRDIPKLLSATFLVYYRRRNNVGPSSVNK